MIATEILGVKCSETSQLFCSLCFGLFASGISRLKEFLVFREILLRFGS